MRVSIVCLLLISAGCASSGQVPGQASGQERGSIWPSFAQLKQASINSLKDPNVWIPTAGAALVAVSGLDNPLSKDANQESKLFGDPQGSSDDLKDLAAIAYVASAFVAPRANFKERLQHIGVDFAAISTGVGVATVLKRYTSRERPSRDNRKSFPSGHATLLGAYANTTRRNINAIDMPNWAATSLNLTVYGITIAGSWARVEAGKHHISDVLVGYALGNYVTNVFHEIFIETNSPVQLSFQSLPQGGALTLTRRLQN